MPWATVARNVTCRSNLQGMPREAAEQRAAQALERVGLAAFRRCLSARTLRRHENARLDRPRARHRSAAAADGRAVRGTRRDHPFQAQQRSARAVAGGRPHGHFRHPFGVRVGLSVAPDRGDDAAAGPGLCRDRDRRALSARRALSHLRGLRGPVPDRVAGAGERHGGRGGFGATRDRPRPSTAMSTDIAGGWPRFVLPVATVGSPSWRGIWWCVSTISRPSSCLVRVWWRQRWCQTGRCCGIRCW